MTRDRAERMITVKNVPRGGGLLGVKMGANLSQLGIENGRP